MNENKIIGEIGVKIRKLRETHSLSQEEMAIKLEIAQGTLCKIESGEVKKVNFVLIWKICNLFNVGLEHCVENSSRSNQDNKKTAISVSNNPTVNNNFPGSILVEVQRLIEENKQLKAKIAELENGKQQ